jgi:hypothetical protein
MSELNQKESYKKEIEHSLKEIVEIYTRIVVDYLHFMKKSKKIQQKTCFKFILYRGLETMTRVFNYILLFTKNLDIAKSYSEKSMFYYIEFVSQINKDQHAFLQFTTRDAVIYVYKKTIYEIRNAFSADPTNETIRICNDVHLYTQMMQNAASSCEDLLDEVVIKKFEKIYLSLDISDNYLSLVEKSFPNLNI